jgi:hypothetical protein
MPTDSSLVTDTSIFMNDGSPDWWLSDDVKLTNPASGVAQPGIKNDIKLTVRRNANALLGDPQEIWVKVDLYVCVPTASPFVLNSNQVKKIKDATTTPAQDIVVDFANLPASGSFPQTIKWDLPVNSPSPAESPGHKCLLARAYQSTLNGTTGTLPVNVVTDDPHYAQRNICIQTCNSPCGVDVMTENPEEHREPKAVTFKVVADLLPGAGVLKAALPLLKEVKGFRRIVNTAPRKGFTLEMRDFPDAKLTDNTRPGCFSMIQGFINRGKPDLNAFQPSFEAQVNIKPGQLSLYQFATDLDGSEPGDAHIFHLMHLEQERILGGLTIVMVKL